MTSTDRRHDGAPHAELYIERGWPLSALKTIEQCDHARDVLVAAIAKIEAALRTAEANALTTGAFDDDWAHRARQALRCKKAAKERVREIRARMVRQERVETQNQRILDILRVTAPEAFGNAIKQAREMYPEIEWRS